MIRWPSARSERTTSRSVSSGARTTSARLSTILRTASADCASTRSLPTASSTAPLQASRDLVEDSRRDPFLRGFLDSLFSLRGYHHDLVLPGVEADVFARDVVEDDQVEALGRQLLARAREPLLAMLGR